MPSKLLLLDKVRGPRIQKEMAQHLENGVPVDMSAKLVGICEATHYNWLNWAQASWEKRESGKRLSKKDTALIGYLEAIRRAEAEAVRRNTLIIQVAARESWQAAAWYLERRYPDTWGRKEKQELSGPRGAPIEVKGDFVHQLMQQAESGSLAPDVVDDELPEIQSTDETGYLTDGTADSGPEETDTPTAD